MSSLSLTALAQTVVQQSAISSAKNNGGVLVRSGEDRYGATRPRPFGSSAFKVSTQDTHGGLFISEHRLNKKGGPPLHLHHGEDELFYVMDGEFVVEIGGVRYDAKAGDAVLGPKGIPHTWAFVGDVGKMLLIYAPAGKMEDFFSERDRHRGGALVDDAAFLRKYGMELLGPPLKI